MDGVKIDLTGEQIQTLKRLFDKGHRYAEEQKDREKQFVILAQVFDKWNMFGNNDRMTFGLLLGRDEGIKELMDLLNKHKISRYMPSKLDIKDDEGFIKFKYIELHQLTHPVPFAATCQVEIKNMGLVGYIHCEVNEYCFITVGDGHHHRMIRAEELDEIKIALNYFNEGNRDLLKIHLMKRGK